jgi:transcriptional regulator with GAF, ATPase, and Fis domain
MFDSLKRVALEMASAPDSKALLPWLVGRLVEGGEGTAAVAIWELGHGVACAPTPGREECGSGDDCLHLVALAARPARGAAPSPNPDLERALQRMPLTALDSPQSAGLEALRREENRRWVPFRLVHRKTVVGAMGLLLPDAADPSMTEMLELIANQLAAVIANERALEEIRQLKGRLDQSGLPRPAPGTPVVSEADLRRFERANIVAALEATGGRVYGRGGAAELLGLKPTTLASRLKKLGLTTRTSPGPA